MPAASHPIPSPYRNHAPKRVASTTFRTLRVSVFTNNGTIGVEDDASTISQTPTTHYTSTCVELTIVTHLSFSERIAISNLSYTVFFYKPSYFSVPFPISLCWGEYVVGSFLPNRVFLPRDHVLGF